MQTVSAKSASVAWSSTRRNLTAHIFYQAHQQKTKIVPPIGTIDSSLVAELMAVISLAQQSLKSGDPLPAVLPSPLFARSIRFARRPLQDRTDQTDNLFRRDGFERKA